PPCPGCVTSVFPRYVARCCTGCAAWDEHLVTRATHAGHRDETAGANAGRMPVSTHCPYCALQCGMTLTPAGEVGAGSGGLCRKGWTSADLLRSPQRLTSPLVRDRKGGPLREASW